jgi:hypothetical protein
MSTHASTSSWLTLDSPSIQHERTLFHLTDDETAMLLDLCHRIPDYNPHLLLKFLFAKKLNVDKAEATFKVRSARSLVHELARLIQLCSLLGRHLRRLTIVSDF